MPGWALSQFLTALATDSCLYAAFLNDPRGVAHYYLSPADCEALFSGDSDSIIKRLCAAPPTVPAAHGQPPTGYAIKPGSAESGFVSTGVMNGAFNFFDL